MHMAAIGVESTPIPLVVVFKDYRLGYKVYHVEAEALDSLFLPKAQDILKFTPHSRILPVKICLSLVEKVQVPLAKF